MYNYSPISSIVIKNFRNIGEMALDFAESPIIALCGDNEAGKTSVVKSVAVCALHAFSREQKEWIREGTQGFGVAISLEDGTQVVRLKTSAINRYTVKSADGSVWETNKIDSGLPVLVQDAMGLSEEPETKEFLQIRTYENQLLFVTTSASSNYKVMYDALKVDQLTRAIKAGSLEVNALKAQINTDDIGIQTLNTNLRQMRIVDIEPAVNIKNRLKSQIAQMSKIDKALELLSKIKAARVSQGNLSLIAERRLEEIQVGEVTHFIDSYRLTENIAKLGNLLSIYRIITTADNIDLAVVDKLGLAWQRKATLVSLQSKATSYKTVDQLEEVDTTLLNKLSSTLAVAQRLRLLGKQSNSAQIVGVMPVEQTDFNIAMRSNNASSLADKISQLIKSRAEVQASINETSLQLKNCGALVSDCPNCGETVIMSEFEAEQQGNGGLANAQYTG